MKVDGSDLMLTMTEAKEFWEAVGYCDLQEAVYFADKFGVTSINELFMLLDNLPWNGFWRTEDEKKPPAPTMFVKNLAEEATHYMSNGESLRYITLTVVVTAEDLNEKTESIQTEIIQLQEKLAQLQKSIQS